MEVFGIGFLEVLAILVVMVIIFGPNRLPEIAKSFGRSVRELRSYAREFRDEHLTDLEEVRDEYMDIRHEVIQENNNFRSEIKHIDEDMRNILIETKTDALTTSERTKPTNHMERNPEISSSNGELTKEKNQFLEEKRSQFSNTNRPPKKRGNLHQEKNQNGRPRPVNVISIKRRNPRKT